MSLAIVKLRRLPSVMKILGGIKQPDNKTWEIIMFFYYLQGKIKSTIFISWDTPEYFIIS